MNSASSVLRAATHFAAIVAVVVVSWIAIGFLAGLAIRAAKFAMEL